MLLKRLRISDRALESIRREVRRKPEVETGGILVGFRREGEAIVTHATGPGPQALHGPDSFVKDTSYLQEALNHLFQYFKVNYLGVWHKHPPDYPTPSPKDIEDAREELGDKGIGLEGFLLPISIIKGEEVKVFPFLVEKDSIHPLAWETVPYRNLAASELLGVQWHQTPLGKERLAKELSLLKEAGVEVEIRQNTDGAYTFHFPLPEGKTLIASCPPDYPVYPPDLLIGQPATAGYIPIHPPLWEEWGLYLYLLDLYKDQLRG